MNSRTLSQMLDILAIKANKHRPTIMVIGSTIGVITGTYLACKSSTKLPEKTAEFKQALADLHDVKDRTSKKEYAQFAMGTYAHIVCELGKMYGPSAAVIGSSLVGFNLAHKEMLNRNTDLLATATVLERGFTEYRRRVVESYGEEVDKCFRYGLTKTTVDDPVLSKNGEPKLDKDGNPKVKQTDILVGDKSVNQYSQFARIFDESNPCWEKSSAYNKQLLLDLQHRFNDRLENIGYVTLNEVYDALGFEKTRDGHNAGWVYDPTHKFTDLPQDNKHGYIDFGIFDIFNCRDSEAKRRFINEYERSVILDFNISTLDVSPYISLIKR